MMLQKLVEGVVYSRLFTFLTHTRHTHYTLKRESLVGTLEAPRGVRQMNGVPQSGADRSATAESRVRANCSNRFTVNRIVLFHQSFKIKCFKRLAVKSLFDPISKSMIKPSWNRTKVGSCRVSTGHAALQF